MRHLGRVPYAQGLDLQAHLVAERQAGRITYVHCRNGVSRSGFVVVAYVMYKNG